ncbi:hypothetical protein JW968_04770 [Candidatus Woesearchaeota archaeon]|nr:hypothetical protein [Candidatus Woesearchaeota archaeon]
MEVKKTVKRIVALGVGASMLGATMLGAMAADLADYPAPFVANGVFNGVIVVGDDAKADDIVGAIDVATGLQFSMKTTTGTGGGSSVVVFGDSFQVSDASDDLTLGENVKEVISAIDDNELEALSGGSIRNQYGTHTYTEDLYLPDATVLWTIDNEDDDEVAGWYLLAEDGALVYEYTVTFTPHLEGETDVDDNRGTTIDEIEDASITLFGKEYVIIEATCNDDHDITLELMGGSTMDTIEEGETKTYTISGTDYEVKAIIVSDTANDGDGSVKFNINGEVTKGLEESDTYTLTDGTQIGIREILPNEAGETTGGDLVEFYLGANSVEITDSDTQAAGGGNIKVGDDSLDIETEVDALVNCSNGEEVKIASLYFNYTAGEDLYVPVGGSMSEEADDREGEEGYFLLHGFDFIFEGLEGMDSEEIEFVPNGDEQYDLKFTNKMGDSYSIPLVYYDGGFEFGEYDETDPNALVTDPGIITEDDYFIVNNDDMEKTRIFQFTGIDDDKKVLQLKEQGSMEKYEWSYSGTAGTYTLDGQTITFNAINEAAENFTIVGVQMDHVWTRYNGYINLSDATQISVRGSDEYNEAGPDSIVVKFTWDGTEMDATLNKTVMGAEGVEWDEKAKSDASNKIKHGVTYNYGMEWEYDTDDDQKTIEIWHPEEYRVAQVFVTAGKVTSSTIEGTAATSVTKIEVGAAKLASEIASATAQNVISVGGSCVNKVTASLLGLSYPACGADSGIPENSAIMKLVENGGKVGLIVAGWEADDTRRATTVLGDYDGYTLSGDEMWVSGTSMSDITVSAPTTE